MRSTIVFVYLGIIVGITALLYGHYASFDTSDPCFYEAKRIKVTEGSAQNLPKVDGCYKAQNRGFTTQYSTSRIKKKQKATSSISTTKKRGSILNRF